MVLRSFQILYTFVLRAEKAEIFRHQISCNSTNHRILYLVEAIDFVLAYIGGQSIMQIVHFPAIFPIRWIGKLGNHALRTFVIIPLLHIRQKEKILRLE